MFCRLGLADDSLSRRRAGLPECGVQAAGGGIQQRGQGIDVGRFEFRELAVFQHQPRDVVSFGQVFQHIDGGGNGLALAVFHRLGQIHFVEEHVAQLLRRIDVELGSGELVDFACLGLDFALQPRRHLFQNFAVDLDPGLLHPRQNRHQRQINFFVQASAARTVQPHGAARRRTVP